MTTLDTGMVIAARYRVLREIGRGGMGAVYAVEHTRTGDQLALKILLGSTPTDTVAISRFKREARASARIKSDNVVRVIDADIAPELDGAPFLVMELLAGTDLEQHIRSHGPMSTAEVLGVLGQVAAALERAHALGIVHRDLKPENVFLHRLPDGKTLVKLLDFGISKVVSNVAGIESAAGMTTTGSVLGTPLYMAPEQAHGQHDRIGPATDVWALGLVAMRLLTGDNYWTATNIAELVTCIVVRPMPAPSARWPRLTWINPAIDEWFARSCARDPEQRWSSVTEQIRALAQALQTEIPIAHARESSADASSEHAIDPIADTLPHDGEARRKRLWPIVLVPILALGVAATGNALVHRSEAPATTANNAGIQPLPKDSALPNPEHANTTQLADPPLTAAPASTTPQATSSPPPRTTTAATGRATAPSASGPNLASSGADASTLYNNLASQPPF